MTRRLSGEVERGRIERLIDGSWGWGGAYSRKGKGQEEGITGIGKKEVGLGGGSEGNKDEEDEKRENRGRKGEGGGE